MPVNTDFITKSKILFLTWANVSDHFATRELALAEFGLLTWNRTASHCPDLVSFCVEFYPTEPTKFHIHGYFTYSVSYQHNITAHFNFQGIPAIYKRVSASLVSRKNLVKYLAKGSGTVNTPRDVCAQIVHTFEDEEIKASFKEALQCASKVEAEEYIKNNLTDKWFTCHNSIRNCLDYSFHGVLSDYTTPQGYVFTPPQPIVEWTETSFLQVIFIKSWHCYFDFIFTPLSYNF